MPDATSLFDAVRAADLRTVTDMLSTDPELIRATDAEGNTPLHAAAAWLGIAWAAEWMSKNSTSPEQQEAARATLRDLPAPRDLQVLLLGLLESGVPIDIAGADGSTPLHTCAQLNVWYPADVLLKHGANIEARDDSGETPLHRSVREVENAGFAMLLVERGADINARSGNGMTPLHWAALLGRCDTVREILDAGADIDAVADEPVRNTALVMAIQAGDDPENSQERMATIRLLVERGANLRAGLLRSLDAAALEGDVRVFELLLPYFGDIHSSTSSFELTSLHLASIYGRLEMMQFLLERGAEPNAVATDGGTPLDVATRENQPGAIELLRRWGGKVSQELPSQAEPPSEDRQAAPADPDFEHVGEVIWPAIEADPRVILDAAFLRDLDHHMRQCEEWLTQNYRVVEQGGHPSFGVWLETVPADVWELAYNHFDASVEYVSSTGYRVLQAGSELVQSGEYGPQDLVAVNTVMERAVSVAASLLPTPQRVCALGDLKLRLARARVTGRKPQDAAPCFQQAIELDPADEYADVARNRLRSIEQHPTEAAPVSPEKKSGGCYIATACYGSYDHPDVIVLRRYRDERLLASLTGAALVRLYYAVSPPLARYIGGVGWLARAVREYCLEPIVRHLS